MSSWQDIVFAIGSLVFIVSLVPMVRAPEKPPLSASLPTATVLAVFAATYTTMSLTYAAVTTAVTAALWTTLAVQRLTRNEREVS